MQEVWSDSCTFVPIEYTKRKHATQFMKLIGIERELFGNSVNKVVGVLPEREPSALNLAGL
jgi:hypothetical protein